MNWKDTVISYNDMLYFYTHSKSIHAIEKQAKVTWDIAFKAARQEVVEWVEKFRYSTSLHNVTFRIPTDKLQAKLKEWDVE